METKNKIKVKKEEAKSIVGALERVPSRGRIFEGIVVKKFTGRVVIEFERTVKIRKYERFYKKKTKIHARLPSGINIEVGDYVRVQECRPLSKIIHAIVIEKIRSTNLEEKK
ncbi:MAG: 30S ribosomal protein S17 [Nanoarchaeota archaeon]